jgi:hypothetical protein
MTLKEAANVGYDTIAAGTVAFEDQAVDTGWRHPWIRTPAEILWPLVSGKDMLHFPARAVAVGDMNRAISACDLKAFGAALHRFQDSFSHNFTTWSTPMRRICASWCWVLNPLAAAAILTPNPAYGRGAALKHACLGNYPDDHNPEQQARDASMKQGTRSWLLKYRKKCSAATSADLRFESESFSAGTGGPITATPQPSGKNIRISSAPYSPSGRVKVSGGTDEQAKDWEAGFIQTAKQGLRRAHYIGSKDQKLRTVSIPGARRDALVAGGAPWYDPNNSNGPGRVAFAKTDSSVKVSLWDRPGTTPPWDTPDGKGKLNHHSGKDIFTAWMIARKKTAPNDITFLNWTSWEVDYGVTFNYASKGTKTVNKITGTTSNTGSGTGKGKDNPVLTGKIANDSATTVWS